VNANDLVAALRLDLATEDEVGGGGSQVLRPIKETFKRLWQVERALKTEEERIIALWQSFGSRRICSTFEKLRSHDQPPYVQAFSLLKISTAVLAAAAADAEEEEVAKKQEEAHNLTEQLLAVMDRSILDSLDASLPQGRCQPLYDSVQKVRSSHFCAYKFFLGWVVLPAPLWWRPRDGTSLDLCHARLFPWPANAPLWWRCEIAMSQNPKNTQTLNSKFSPGRGGADPALRDWDFISREAQEESPAAALQC
jgi:hypothetical protein